MRGCATLMVANGWRRWVYSLSLPPRKALDGGGGVCHVSIARDNNGALSKLRNGHVTL